MSEEPEIRPRSRGKAWAFKGIFALAASVATFWWAFHDVDFKELSRGLAGTSVATVLLYAVLQLSLHLVRVVRWGLLIRPLGNPSWRAIFAAASVGFPASFFLPLRLGELVRPAMISRSGVSFPSAMASVVVERLADGLFNVGVFFLLLSMLPPEAPIPAELRSFSIAALVVFAGGLGGLVATCLAKRRALSLIRAILSPLSPAFAERVVGLLDTFIAGVTVLRTPGRLLGFVALTAVFWLSNGVITWMLARSYVPDIPLMLGPFTIAVSTFAVMIPAGPAFAGTLEAGFRLGMAPFAVGPGASAVVAVAVHFVQLAQMAFLAGIGFVAAESKQTEKSVVVIEPK